MRLFNGVVSTVPEPQRESIKDSITVAVAVAFRVEESPVGGRFKKSTAEL